MNENTKTLLDLGLTFIELGDECFGIFASTRDKMEKRVELIKEKYPETTMRISLNSCEGDILVDLTGKKYSLNNINKEILFNEYKKEITNALKDEATAVRKIEKIQCSYRHYLKEGA